MAQFVDKPAAAHAHLWPRKWDFAGPNNKLEGPPLATYHTSMIVEEQSTRNGIQYHLHMWPRLQQNVREGDDCLAQQCPQLTHAVRGC